MSSGDDQPSPKLLLLRQREALERILDAAASEHVHALAREGLGMNAVEAEIDRRQRLPQGNTRLTFVVQQGRRDP